MDHKTLPPELTYLTEHEAALVIGRKVSTLRADRVRGGGVPFIKIKASVRYRLSDIVEFMSARVCTSTSENKSARGGE